MEIVIVGGGPAGLTAALTLQAACPNLAGRVRVIEQARYPREKICAGAVGGRGLAILEALGALPPSPFVALDGAVLRTRRGDVTIGGLPIGRVVRRASFDASLADLARARGVHIEENCSLLEIRREDHTNGGPGALLLETSRGILRPSLVIGADGVGSRVRKFLEETALPASTRDRRPARLARAQVLEVDTELVPEDRAGPSAILPGANGHGNGRVLFDLTDPMLAGYTWHFPTPLEDPSAPEGRLGASRGIYWVRVDGDTSPRVDLEATLDRVLAQRGLRLKDHRKKRYAERGLPLSGPLATAGLMLIGEAAGIDPVTGEGIAQAIEYGHLAGVFVGACGVRGEDLRTSATRWTETLRRSRLGRDLWVRARALRAFYGAWREDALDTLAGEPRLVEAAMRHFGGLPQRLDAPQEFLPGATRAVRSALRAFVQRRQHGAGTR
jgi:flavin-dependent dehydrogenase